MKCDFRFEEDYSSERKSDFYACDSIKGSDIYSDIYSK